MSAHRDLAPSVLIVDDEEAICLLIKMKLEMLGYATRIANRGADAMDVLREGCVEAMISDQDLPDMKGTELYKRASVLQPHLRERFLFITGNSSLSDTDFPCRLLHKPFDLCVLAEAIQDMLASSKRTQPAGC